MYFCADIILTTLPTHLQKRPWFLRFMAIIFKENIQNKLNYAISVYRIHRLNRQPFLALLRGLRAHNELGTKASTDVNNVFRTENFEFFFFCTWQTFLEQKNL